LLHRLSEGFFDLETQMGAGPCHAEPFFLFLKPIQSTAATAAVATLALALSACGAVPREDHPKMPLDVPVAQLSGLTVVSGYGTVQSVDLVPRELAAIGIGRQGIIAGSASFLHQIATETQRDKQVYRVALRMEDGTIRVFAQDRKPDFDIGDRVHVANGNIAHP
jgi:hypothetical protein